MLLRKTVWKSWKTECLYDLTFRFYFFFFASNGIHTQAPANCQNHHIHVSAGLVWLSWLLTKKCVSTVAFRNWFSHFSQFLYFFQTQFTNGSLQNYIVRLFSCECVGGGRGCTCVCPWCIVHVCLICFFVTALEDTIHVCVCVWLYQTSQIFMECLLGSFSYYKNYNVVDILLRYGYNTNICLYYDR